MLGAHQYQAIDQALQSAGGRIGLSQRLEVSHKMARFPRQEMGAPHLAPHE